jgi:hypothetical protein
VGLKLFLHPTPFICSNISPSRNLLLAYIMQLLTFGLFNTFNIVSPRAHAMRSVGSRLAPIERLALDTFSSSPQRLYVCRACSRRFPATLGTPATYSTTAGRRAEDVGLPVQRRETTTWERLKWVGSPEWVDNFMKPRRPLKP